MAEVLKMSGHRCTKPTFVELGGGGIRVQAKNGEIILSFTFIFGVFGRTNSQGAQYSNMLEKVRVCLYLGAYRPNKVLKSGKKLGPTLQRWGRNSGSHELYTSL